MKKTILALLALIAFGGYALANMLIIPHAVVAYVGPGDIQSGATVFYSPTRAYTAAYAAANGKLANVIRASDSHTCDILSATTGGIGLTASCSTGGDNGASLATFLTSTTGKFVTWYDQSGALNCGGAACDVTQATGSKQPAVTLSCIGSLTCGTFSNASVTGLGSAANMGTQAQPVVCYGVANRTNGAQGTVYLINQGTGDLIGWTTANLAAISAGTALTATASDNAWHVILGLLAGNGTSSVIAIDNTETANAAGTTGFTAAQIGVGSSRGTGTNNMSGLIGEAGCWPTTMSAGNRTALSANAHSFWGF